MPRRAELTAIPFGVNFPTFYLADFLLQITELPIPDRGARALPAFYIMGI